MQIKIIEGELISVDLDGNEVAEAIYNYLKLKKIKINGPATVQVYGNKAGASVIVDPAASFKFKRDKE